MKKLLPIFFIIISLPVSVAFAYRFNFDGTNTSLEVYNNTGISVGCEGTKKFMIVNNTALHYKVGLPCSEKWVFDYEKGHLKGNSGFWNFDVQIWAGDETPEQHLLKIQEYLRDSAPVKDNEAKIISFENESILRSEIALDKVNPTFVGAKQLHLYTVRKSKRTLYKLHLSVIIPPDKAGTATVDERFFLALTAKGFTVD